ncbi:carbohydrate kinase family protein [Paracidovorax cattleyae]|uniref:Fructokinase n=1 Tax=Paracidovorax cattleyae TaxID=80868 RepID=A0A1H0SFI5_9BURK|nr:carbohydrate kinase [Paracidovorax cattleyae]AVS73252.1 carbohydrate kinase [Paracidovorax cattleyae]MBF9265503.1 carbohydrate kinase [Paracidovorax cattleyae]SDP39926.1 fructokinase [Paracidovorax cattleyae]
MRAAFMGEALIDFTSSRADGALGFAGHVGGSPLNAAIACARLGQSTGLLTQLSTDLFGERILDYLQRNGVDTRFVPRSAAPSTLAFVERTPQTNRYAFYAAGSADATWAPDPLPELPPECAFLHFGSIAMLQQPASARILDMVRASAGRRVVLLDPNVRPSLIADMAHYRAQVVQWAGLSDVVKLSDEDAELLAPGQPPGALAADYLAAGAHAVVVTQGAAGATLWRTGHAPLAVAAPHVQVADTIGAGDTFTAGLSAALLSQGVGRPAQLAALDGDGWRTAMRFAATAAALNCMREGADPPSLAAVQGLLACADNVPEVLPEEASSRCTP